MAPEIEAGIRAGAQALGESIEEGIGEPLLRGHREGLKTLDKIDQLTPADLGF